MKKIITTLLLTLCGFFALSAQDYVVTPADGTEVTELIEVQVTWPDESVVDVNMMLMDGGIKVYLVDGENKTLATDVFCGPAWGPTAVLTMKTPIYDAGEYLVEIPDNMFTVDGVAVPAFTLSYAIGGIPTSNAKMEVFMEGESLETLKVVITPCTTLELNSDEEIEAPFIINNTGFDAYIASRYVVTINEDNTATLTAEKALPNGFFTLHIPKATFLIDGKLSRLVTVDFDKSGINDILDDNVAVNVYNLNGVQLVKAGTKEDLGTLPNGIYVVNGKKVIVKNSK